MANHGGRNTKFAEFYSATFRLITDVTIYGARGCGVHLTVLLQGLGTKSTHVNRRNYASKGE